MGRLDRLTIQVLVGGELLYHGVLISAVREDESAVSARVPSVLDSLPI